MLRSRLSPLRFRPTFVEALESRMLLNAGGLDPSFSSDGKATFTGKYGRK